MNNLKFVHVLVYSTIFLIVTELLFVWDFELFFVFLDELYPIYACQILLDPFFRWLVHH